MPHGLPCLSTSAKMIKRSINHYYAWLNEIKDCTHNPETAIEWAHLACFVQTGKSILTLVKHREFSALPALLRKAGDSIINCAIIQNDVTHEELIVSALLDKQRRLNRIRNQLRTEYNSDEITTAEQFSAELIERTSALPQVNSYMDLTIQERWRRAGFEKEYHLFYSQFSENIHCNPETLDRLYCEEINGVPTLKWEEANDQQVFLSNCYFNFAEIATPCFIALSNKLESIQTTT